MSEGKYKYSNTDFKKVSAKMYDFKCDVKLTIGNQTFRAHKEVLSDASDYFSAMFGHDMREKEQSSIEFHEISPQGFTCMLEYFYHGHITLDPDNIENVIEASRFFHIEWLIAVSCDFLIRHLSLENYDSVLNLADKYFLGDLRKDIFRFITHNFMMLAEQPPFMMLSYELFHQLLADDYYIEAPEYFIFQKVLKWLDFDHNREQYFIPMLQLIRYALMDPSQLETIGDDIMSKPELEQLVRDAKEFHVAPSLQCLLTSEQTEARGGQEVVMMFSALDDAHLIQYKVPGLVGFFSEEINSIFMQSVFEFTSIAVLGNYVFVAGGYKRHSWCSTEVVYRYNPRNREWGLLTPMQQARVSFALCVAERGLYAVAGIDHVVEEGRDTETILDTVEYYDPKTGDWRYIPNLPVAGFSMGACVLDESLYVSGGISDNPEDTVPVNYMRKISPGDENWMTLAPMLTERQGHAMTPYKNMVYAIGGYTSALDTMTFEHCLTIEAYDVETDQWSHVGGVLNHGHIHNSVAVLDDKFYLLGGKDHNRLLITFDPEKEEEVDAEFAGELVTRIVQARIAFPVDDE